MVFKIKNSGHLVPIFDEMGYTVMRPTDSSFKSGHYIVNPIGYISPFRDSYYSHELESAYHIQYIMRKMQKILLKENRTFLHSGYYKIKNNGLLSNPVVGIYIGKAYNFSTRLYKFKILSDGLVGTIEVESIKDICIPETKEVKRGIMEYMDIDPDDSSYVYDPLRDILFHDEVAIYKYTNIL